MSDATRIEIDAKQGWRMVLRRSAALLSGEAAARAVGFLVVLILARRLGPNGFGLVTLGLALVGWFTFVVDSGTEQLNVREVARYPSRFRHIGERVLGLRLALSLLAMALFVAGVEIFAKSAHTRDTVVLFAILLPFIALNLRWMVLGVGGSRGIAAGNIASRVVVLVGVLLLVPGETDVDRVPFLEAAGQLAYGLIVLVYVGRRVGFLRPRVDLEAWWSMLRQSVSLLVSGVARATIYTFDVILISLSLGPASVGIYGVATRPVMFLAGAAALFALSFLSAFSATAGGEAAALHGRALRVTITVYLAAAAVLSAAAPLIPYVFGQEYADAVPVLAVLAWRIPFVALGSMYTTVLLAHGRQTTLMKNSIVVALVVVLLDTVAILLFGLMGAAVGGIIASGMFFLANHRSVARYDPTFRATALGRSPGASDGS
jgi:O-antigen/teichoic acid export membrane protein